MWNRTFVQLYTCNFFLFLSSTDWNLVALWVVYVCLRECLCNVMVKDLHLFFMPFAHVSKCESHPYRFHGKRKNSIWTHNEQSETISVYCNWIEKLNKMVKKGINSLKNIRCRQSVVNNIRKQEKMRFFILQIIFAKQNAKGDPNRCVIFVVSQHKNQNKLDFFVCAVMFVTIFICWCKIFITVKWPLTFVWLFLV